MKIINLASHIIYPKILNSKSIVLDLGANVGSFSEMIIDKFDCKVYAIEASPHTFSQIKASNKLLKYNYAVCEKSGEVTLNISSNPEATSLNRLKNFDYIDKTTVKGITLSEFIAKNIVDKINLLKIDIEGSEIEVLGSCTDDLLKSIDQITVEFHDWCHVVSSEDVSKVITRIKKLGFVFIKFSNDNHNVLFINKKNLSPLDIILIKIYIPVMRIINILLVIKKLLKKLISNPPKHYLHKSFNIRTFLKNF